MTEHQLERFLKLRIQEKESELIRTRTLAAVIGLHVSDSDFIEVRTQTREDEGNIDTIDDRIWLGLLVKLEEKVGEISTKGVYK